MNTKPKHTTGPWKYLDSTKIASHQYKNQYVIVAGDKQIAEFSWHDNSPWFPIKEESQANASLIAAAPDMLEELEHALEILGDEPHETEGGSVHVNECARRIHALIKKVKGL